MFVPAAMNIESAADMLKNVPDRVREDQLKELHSFGSGRAMQLGASGMTTDFEKGYELGLQTARAILAGSAQLIIKGVDPKAVL